jgi:hypothetical protein
MVMPAPELGAYEALWAVIRSLIDLESNEVLHEFMNPGRRIGRASTLVFALQAYGIFSGAPYATWRSINTAEIADHMNIAGVTVQRHIARARAVLMKVDDQVIDDSSAGIV